MIFDLAAVEEIKDYCCQLDSVDWFYSGNHWPEDKGKGLVKGRRIFSLLSCSGHALKAQYCLEPRTFVVALSDLSDPSGGTFYIVHCSRVNPTPRELHRIGKAANPRCSSIKSTQRSRKPLSVHCVSTEKAIYFSISGTVHASGPCCEKTAFRLQATV